MNKRIIAVLVVLLILTTGLVISRSNINSSNLRTDSGFDTDYSGGGDYGGSSSWSSSDYDYSPSYSHSSSSNGTGEVDLEGFFSIMIFIIFMYIIFIGYPSSAKRENLYTGIYEDISEEELQKLLPEYTLEQLKQELYNRFVEIQNAWMNFDYNCIEEDCTNELYNSYKQQLKVLKIKKQQNVMQDFHRIEMYITKVYERDNTIAVETFLKVSFLDYIVNTNNQRVEQGKSYRPITNHYEMTFVRSKISNSKIPCPHCGSELDITVTQECPYCNSIVVVTPNKLVLSKKTNRKTI